MIVSTAIAGIGLDKALLKVAVATGADVAGSVYRSGAMLRTRVRVKASTGRHKANQPHIPGTGPGPNVVTGDYRRSISQHNRLDAGVAEAHVYTNSPQALRLEYGFRGTDALGRTIDQPPYPHWRPATEGINDVLAKEINASIAARLAVLQKTALKRRLFGGR